MELRHYLRIVLIHKRSLLLMCLSATLTSILITYLISEKYRGSAIVFIQPTESMELANKGKEMMGFPFPATYTDPIKNANQTYIELIKSRNITERVVVQLGLHKEDEKHEPNFFKRIWKKSKKEMKTLIDNTWTLFLYGRIEETDPLESMVSILKKKLSAEPIKDTYLFQIKAEFGDPNVAAAIANTAAHIFVEYSKDVLNKKDREYTEFIKGRKDISEKELIQLRDALKNFKMQNKITHLKKETELKLSALSDFENSLKKTENSLKEVTAGAKKVQKQLARENTFLKSSITISNNPLVQDLKSRLASLEIERTGLLEKFTPVHKEVITVNSQITEITKKLEREVHRIVSDEATTLNVVHENLRKELMALETEKNSLEARRNALLSVIDRYRDDLKAVADREMQLSELELWVNIAENNFTHLSQKYEDARVNEAKRLSEIRIVQEAVPPVYPARPLKVVYAATALLLSLLVGVGAAFIMEYANISIRNVKEAEEVLDLPVLGTIPQIKSYPDRGWILCQNSDLSCEAAVTDVQGRSNGPGVQ